MFDSTFILERLRNGESIDTIAADLTSAINEANSAYAEELAQTARRNESNGKLADILLDLADWYSDRYGTPIPDDFDALELAEKVTSAADNVQDFLPAANEIASFLSSSFSWNSKDKKGKISTNKNGKVSTKEITDADWDSLLADFVSLFH